MGRRSAYSENFGLMRLTLLAPPIIEAILNGRQPEGVTLAVLAEGVPTDWEVQRSRFGASNAGARGDDGL